MSTTDDAAGAAAEGIPTNGNSSADPERPAGAPSGDRVGLPAFGLVLCDLYRDIHKAIRSELFAATVAAGRLDPGDHRCRADLAEQVAGVVSLLASHAGHEDRAIQPALEQHLPVLAEIIEGDHRSLELRTSDLVEMSAEAVDAPSRELRARLHQLYLELGSFTAAYLRHQDTEERVIMPALESVVGVDEVRGLHRTILSGIPPQEMAGSLATMLPVMNLEDRVEMLCGMRAASPPEAFDRVSSLARSVLAAPDAAALERRLDPA